MHKISASCIDASRLFFPDSIRSFQTFYAVMSDYYFGLEFLKAYPGVYTTVFPWLSERTWTLGWVGWEQRARLFLIFLFQRRGWNRNRSALNPVRTMTNDFAIFKCLTASLRAC